MEGEVAESKHDHNHDQHPHNPPSALQSSCPRLGGPDHPEPFEPFGDRRGKWPLLLAMMVMIMATPVRRVEKVVGNGTMVVFHGPIKILLTTHSHSGVGTGRRVDSSRGEMTVFPSSLPT